MTAGEIWSKYKTPIIIAGGGLVFYLVMRKPSAPAVAAAAPVDQGTPMVATPAAAQPDMSTGQSNVDAIQQQMQQEALREQVAGFNLSLLGQQQQMKFYGQQQNIAEQLGQQQVAQAAEETSYEYRVHRGYNPAARGGVTGFVQQDIVPLVAAYSAYSSLPGVPVPGGHTPIPGRQQQPQQTVQYLGYTESR